MDETYEKELGYEKNGISAVVVAVGVLLGGCTPMKSMMGIAFGTDDDVAHAQASYLNFGTCL